MIELLSSVGGSCGLDTVFEMERRSGLCRLLIMEARRGSGPFLGREGSRGLDLLEWVTRRGLGLSWIGRRDLGLSPSWSWRRNLGFSPPGVEYEAWFEPLLEIKGKRGLALFLELDSERAHAPLAEIQTRCGLGPLPKLETTRGHGSPRQLEGSR